MTVKDQTIVKVTIEFRGFGSPAIEELVTTSSHPNSSRWSATLDQIQRKHITKYGGFTGNRLHSVSVALASRAVIE